MKKYLKKLYERMIYYWEVNKPLYNDIAFKLIPKIGREKLFLGIRIEKEEIQSMKGIDDTAKLVLSYIKRFCTEKDKIIEVYSIKLYPFKDNYRISVTFLPREINKKNKNRRKYEQNKSSYKKS